MGASPSSTSDTISLDERGTTSRWSRLASVGLLMEAAAPILMLAAALLWGLDTDDLTFFVLPAVVGFGAALLVRRARTLWKVLAIVLGVLIAVMLFWTAFGLVEPGSFFDFVPGLLIVPGVLITLVAGIASIRSAKHGPVSSRDGGERRAMAGVLGTVGLLAGVSAVLTMTGQDSVSADLAAEADVVVDLKNYEFDQASYATSGDTTVLVKNSDPFLHTFTIDDLDIDIEVTPGSEKLVTIPAQPGTYIVYCRPHTGDPDDPADDDMAATLTVG